MAVTKLADVQEQVATFWSDLAMDELRESLPLPSLIDKKYEGSITKPGDRVKIYQINAPEGELLDAATDDSFGSEKITTESVELVANKRAVASYEVHDVVEFMSQISMESSPVREALVFALSKKINNYIYSLVSPSTSAPDHVIDGVTDFNAAQFSSSRILAAQAKWKQDGKWYALLSPSYYGDALNAQTLTSLDYISGETPVVAGQLVNKRFGFNILEDNSDGILQLSPAVAGTDCALLFHPDFMHMAMVKQVNFRVADLIGQKKFGALIVADVIFGCVQGIDGSKKCIKVYNT